MKLLKQLSLIIIITAAVSFGAVSAAEQPTTAPKTVTKQKPLKKIKTKVSKKEMKKFFNKSAFIGSSIGLVQRIYMKHEGKKYMGHPKMLVKGCYSFTNDKGGKYSISYKGKSGPARYAVKRAKVKRVFINMGTNDLFEGHKKVFQRYKKYIKSMQKVNKGIVIYIESMPPVYKGGEKSHLNNKHVNKLNKNLEKYCKKRKDVYYIDITTPLKDKSGGLAKKYTSDKYVHITMAGYRVWHKKVYKYIKKELKSEKKAKKAVKYAKKFRTSNEIARAKRLVSKLHNSTIKKKLKKQLKTVKVKQ